MPQARPTKPPTASGRREAVSTMTIERIRALRGPNVWGRKTVLEATVRCEPPDCAIAIATPITGDRVAMTNHHWTFSIRELQAQLGLARLRVVNDFTALALALPRLGEADRWQLGGDAPEPGCAIGLIGPGTGLGVSGLLPVVQQGGRGGWLPMQGEGGHGTLGATTAREA